MVFTAGTIGAVMMVLGLAHRLSAAVVFLSWTYIFLLCRGHYTNHYYLFALVAFWLMVTDANRWASLDRLIYKYVPLTRSWILGFSKDVDTVPYWQVLTFKVQLFCVYFYGGLAKFSWDWLEGYPMRIWLPLKPWLPDFMKTEVTALLMSWSGLLFDLLIGFVLLSKYRWWGLPFVLFFHITNELTFRTIGGFPHFMAAATLVFFDPAWPANVVRALQNRFSSTPRPPAQFTSAASISYAWPRKLLLVGLALYWSWQFLYPFRHFLYPGDPSITGEGSVFAWRMMLTSRDYGARMKVVVNGETFYITGDSFFHYVNFRQFTRMCRTPKSFHRFALFLRDEMRKTNPHLNPEIYTHLIVQYNGRPYTHVIDTTVNLAAIPYREWGHINWVKTTPFTEPPGYRYLQEQSIKD